MGGGLISRLRRAGNTGIPKTHEKKGRFRGEDSSRIQTDLRRPFAVCTAIDASKTIARGHRLGSDRQWPRNESSDPTERCNLWRWCFGDNGKKAHLAAMPRSFCRKRRAAPWWCRPKGRSGMNSIQLARGIYSDPIEALLSRESDSVLAVVTGIDGPSYRPLGATMAVFENKQRVGTLSSGCIEKDIALHALEALGDRKTRKIRYGRGSPFIDIKLPCGGGLEVLLVPRPDKAVLGRLAARRKSRVPVTLRIEQATGALSFADDGETGQQDGVFRICYLPEVRFLVFGKGPEAATFVALVRSAGYSNILLSPDEETLQHGASLGCETRRLTASLVPADLVVDGYSAVVLFFHDHDWEPPILAAVLSSPAFYIGAQGSKMARETRNLMLEDMGFDKEVLTRIRGPIGLLPSARDARTLAISVLAEVLAEAPKGVLAT